MLKQPLFYQLKSLKYASFLRYIEICNRIRLFFIVVQLWNLHIRNLNIYTERSKTITFSSRETVDILNIQ